MPTAPIPVAVVEVPEQSEQHGQAAGDQNGGVRAVVDLQARVAPECPERNRVALQFEFLAGADRTECNHFPAFPGEDLGGHPAGLQQAVRHDRRISHRDQRRVPGPDGYGPLPAQGIGEHQFEVPPDIADGRQNGDAVEPGGAPAPGAGPA